MTKMKKLMSVMLAFVMSFSLMAPAMATGEVSGTIESSEILPISVSGYSYIGSHAFYNRGNEDNRDGIGSLSNLSFATNYGETIVSMRLVNSDGKSTDLSFSGILYPSGPAIADERLVMGDFTPSDDYVVVYFRVEKACKQLSTATGSEDIIGKNVVMIVLYDKNNDEYYAFDYQITNSTFEKYVEAAFINCKELSADEIVNGYMNAMMFSNKIATDKSAAPLATTSATFTYNSETTSNTGVYVNPQILKLMLSNLNSTTGKYTVMDGTTTHTMLTQTGWKVYQDLTASAPYMYIMYGEDNGLTNVVRFTLCSMSAAETSGIVRGRMAIQDAAAFEYAYSQSGTSKTATSVYKSYGVDLKNPCVAVGHLEGINTFFMTAKTTYSWYNGEPPKSILHSAIAISKYANLVYNIFSELTSTSATNSNWETTYALTKENQIAEYGGLVRDICSNTPSNARMRTTGNYVAIEGTINGTYSSCDIAYKFTAVQ